MKKSPDAGRKKGQRNRMTTFFKDAIAGAAEDLGELKPVYEFKDVIVRGKIQRISSGKILGWRATGVDGTRGYLRWLGQEYPSSFAALISRTLPLQIDANVNNTGSVAEKFSDVKLSEMTLDQKMAAMQDMLGATKALPAPRKDQQGQQEEITDAEFSEIPRKAAE